jgi:hypothetical protein
VDNITFTIMARIEAATDADGEDAFAMKLLLQ